MVDVRMDRTPVVHVIDDDPLVLRSTISIVKSMRLLGIEHVSAEAFLGTYKEDVVSCLVTDQRLPGMSGVELLRILRRSGFVIPTIILTGFPETSLAVDAMKAGAVTFLEKSNASHRICDAISESLQRCARLLDQKTEAQRLRRIKNSLTNDETQVLQLASQGKLNKEIAFECGVQLRTIEVWRSHLMSKIGATSFSDLMRYAISLEEVEKIEPLNGNPNSDW